MADLTGQYDRKMTYRNIDIFMDYTKNIGFLSYPERI
jgi:hypothetical protein